MRLTRAAMRAEAQQTGTEAQDASVVHSSTKERIPLGEVVANALPIEAEQVDVDTNTKEMAIPKGTKNKGGRKGAKAKQPEKKEPVVEQVEIVLEVQQDSVASSGSDEATNASINTVPHASPAQDIAAQPATTPKRTTRLTRRQIAQQEEETQISASATPLEPTIAVATDAVLQDGQTEHSRDVLATDAGYAAKEQSEGERPLDHVSPSPNKSDLKEVTHKVSVQPELKTLAHPPPVEEQVTSILQDISAATTQRSPSKSPARSPMRLEESIEAIDALEEALEKVGKAIPPCDGSGDESPCKETFSELSSKRAASHRSKKSQSASSTSQNANAAARSITATPTKASLARASGVKATANMKAARDLSGEVVDYLASRRRPVSVSFPTPPPPPKSSRAPTKPAFRLSSDAVAAKLKAQKQERLNRERDGKMAAKPRPISMPAPSKSSKAPTKPNFQLPGEAIAAKLKVQKEERLKREAEGVRSVSGSVTAPPRAKSTKAPTVASFQLPGEAVAVRLKAQREERLKREQEAESARAATFKARPAPARSAAAAAASVRQTVASRARESLMLGKDNIGSANVPTSSVAKRSSILTKSTSSSSAAAPVKRNSVSFAFSNSTNKAPAESALVKQKGREVFNRDKMEIEAILKDRKEKEEAAKRARAEAAERGRIASREWAEKQRRKMMAAKLELGTASVK